MQLSDFRIVDGEGGQALLLFVFMMSVFFAIAALVFDVGLWVSERGGARKDADAAALAGAQAYVNDFSDSGGAFSDAIDWAVLNGVESIKIDGAPTSNCSSGNSCIDVGAAGCRGSDNMPWVQAKIRHPGYTFFASFFGVTTGPDIGGLARACVGSPAGHSDLSPFGVETDLVAPASGQREQGAECGNTADDDGDTVADDGCPLSDCMELAPGSSTTTRPSYGDVCILKELNAAGVSGQLYLSDTACSQSFAGDQVHDFHYGLHGTCVVGDTVDLASSSNPTDFLQGVAERLAEEGLCDTSFGSVPFPLNGAAGLDGFDEVFSIVGQEANEWVIPHPANVFADNDCAIECGLAPLSACPDNASHRHNYMPRAMDLVLVDRLQTSASTATITGFARFFVIGCYDEANAAALKTSVENDPLRDTNGFLNQCGSFTGNESVVGIMVKSLAPAIDVGDPDANLPLSIVLVD